MKKLLVFNFEGKNYYNYVGGHYVNITFDKVDGINEVSDVDCFYMNEPISNIEELKLEVFSVVANEKLHSIIRNELNRKTNLSTRDINLIISKMEQQMAIRENFIVVNFNKIDIEDNLINICDYIGNSFSVGLTENHLGDIVG
ncbi:hypothetical protein ACV3NL_04065 [Clostridium perfringens]|nr:hypothetical protein [Clostridium perfringens]MDK0602571.1 hypothetical protein [Clostridium perfringens]